MILLNLLEIYDKVKEELKFKYSILSHGKRLILYIPSTLNWYNEEHSKDIVYSNIQKICTDSKTDISEKDFKNIYEKLRRTAVVEKGITFDELKEKGTETSDDGYTDRKEGRNRSTDNSLLSNVTLFRNSNEEYIRFNVRGHNEIHKINSGKFKKILTREYFKKHGEINDLEIKHVIDVYQGQALNEKEYKLKIRVAWNNDNKELWYDLTNDKQEAIKITKDGWSIEEPPILFKRYGHELPQVTPIKSDKFKEDINLLFTKKLIKLEDENDNFLYLVNLITKFIPDISHTIDNANGSHGSSKTYQDKFKKLLVDPSKLPSVEAHDKQNKAEVIQQLSHHWLSVFDNMSEMPDWLSDLFCKVTTGQGFSKRVLYTDDEDFIYSYQHCVAINSVDYILKNSDIIDRAITFNFGIIPEEDKKSETDIMKTFDDIKPLVLGSIFDILSSSIKLYDEIKSNIMKLPRMTDYFIWGCCIAESIKEKGAEKFAESYYENIKEKEQEILEEDEMASLLLKFMEDKNEWEGTPTELINEIYKIMRKNNPYIDKCPYTSRAIGRKINRIKVELYNKGVEIRRKRSMSRKILMTKNKKFSS